MKQSSLPLNILPNSMFLFFKNSDLFYRFIYFSLFISCGSIPMSGQFEVPDTVCVGEILEMEYLGDGEHFCIIADANYYSFDLSIESIETFPADLPPLYSHIVKEGENHFIFSTTFHINELVRLDFGNSLSNIPSSSTIYLDSVPGGLEGIQILNDNGHWYGFIVGGYSGVWGEEYLLRLDFGNNLTNIPTVENLGNISNMQFPHDLFITKENGIWIGLVVSKFGNSLHRFNFGESLSNFPAGENLGNIGNLNNPTGFFSIEIENEWYLFVTNESNSLSRIEFGNSLLNTPTGTNLGDLGFLQNPRDISILKICDDFFGLLATRDIENEIIVLEFGNSIENIPSTISLGGFSEFEFPQALTNSQIVAEGIAIFVGSVDNKKLSRIILSSPSSWNVDCQNTLSDFNLSYSEAGTYDFQLIVNDGLPTQTSFCKNIVVIPTPDLDLGNDTTLCVGETLSLATDNIQTTWQNNQAVGNTFDVSETNLYTAKIEGESCSSYDSVFVEFKNCENCLLFPNAFTPDQDGVNDFFIPVLDCEVEFITFHLQIYNRWGQKVFETNNPLEGWDGIFNGKLLTSDVYVWKSFSSYTKSEKVFEKIAHGDLTLIR